MTTIREFSEQGFACRVVLIESERGARHYCGYVRTPWVFNTSTANHLIDAPGGLTYSDGEGEVGFDTAHSRMWNVDEDGEELPAAMNMGDREDALVFDPETVEEETRDLARQLDALVDLLENASLAGGEQV